MDNDALADLLQAARVMSLHEWSDLRGRAPSLGVAGVYAALTARALASERAVADVLAVRFGAPVVVLAESTLDLAALDVVPDALLDEHDVLPLLFDDEVLTVASAAPDREPADRALGAVGGRRVLVVGSVAPILAEVRTAARAARRTGARVWRGARSGHDAPGLALARPQPLPAADAVARALGDILDAALEAPAPRAAPTPPELAAETSPNTEGIPRTASRKLATLRLKQVVRGTAEGGVVSASSTSPASLAAAALPASAPAGPLPAEPTGAGPRALVVEDDDAIRAMLVRALTADGLVVEEAGDGRVAMALIRRTRPDVVVLDAMLPEIHGFDICAALKRSESWAAIPVLMISAVFRGLEHARTIQEVHGAEAFIEKPFDLRHVRHVVAELLQRPRPQTPPADSEDAAARARVEALQAQARGDAHAAIEACRRWVVVDPFAPDGWYLLGTALSHVGDPLGAMHAFERAATYGRDVFPAHVALAQAYEGLGFLRRARATWSRALACAPDPVMAARIREALENWR
jgi:CheY-like chemotaxis protein